MRKKPHISVIIPALNEGAYLEDTLESVARQNYGDFEIIVVDGFSNDNTMKIAGKYTKKIIRCRKKGPAHAKNAGAAAAGGDILVFLDADTEIPEDFLSDVANKFRDKSIAMLGAEIRMKENVLCMFMLKMFYTVSCLLSAVNKTPALICVACRKEDFSGLGGFNTSLPVGEDLDLSFRFGKKGRVRICSYCITSSRRLRKFGFLNMFLWYTVSFAEFLLFNKINGRKYEFGNFNKMQRTTA